MSLKHLAPHTKSGRPHATHVASAARSQASKRRSSRMLLNSSVGMSGEDRLKCTFNMPAKAINLNRHGAAIQVSRDLVVGSVILVRNKQGVQVSARIVSLLTASQGLSTYGVEFVELDEKALNFWGISFPSNA